MVIYPCNIKEWIKFHDLEIEVNKNYTNIYSTKSPKDLFIEPLTYKYMDGFSPNLNKYLHIGHLSNMILAKSIKSLGICEKTVSIYGDTLDGVSKEDSLNKLKEYQELFNYKPNIEYMASKVKYDGNLLIDGEDKYEGTKIFKYYDDKVVGIKSDGSTSYFYQDMALASKLNDSTLYLTGNEQVNHFELLKKFYPNIKHIGLGLVKVGGSKMSSSIGNVILASDFIEELSKKFDNIELIYNVIAGFILKNTTHSDKNITLDTIDNPKNSPGLYLSYTMARLLSAGCEILNNDKFISDKLNFYYMKSKNNIAPNILFNEIVEHCKEINTLYSTHKIVGNEDNKKMFNEKLSDLSLGFKLLGLFNIKKV
jgi:arginyl-tRNA synthetase